VRNKKDKLVLHVGLANNATEQPDYTTDRTEEYFLATAEAQSKESINKNAVQFLPI
jgi:hypothetical protein